MIFYEFLNLKLTAMPWASAGMDSSKFLESLGSISSCVIL